MARVLVVDDSDQLRRLFRTILSAEGHEVVEAANGAEALHTLRTDVVDVMLLDHSMPEMSGLEVLQLLRGLKLAYEPSVLMITALHSAELSARARELGVKDFILKGTFSNEELVRKVHAAA